MRRSISAAILFPVVGLALPPSGFAADPPALHDTGGVLRGLTVASFNGTSQDSIQAITTDSSGNIYVAGTTYSAQFPVKNAAQPGFGEARILSSANLGATWTRAGFPPGDVNVVVPDPVTPQVLFAGGPNGIYKSTNAGQTWAVVYPFSGGNSINLVSLVINPGNHLELAALTPANGTLIRSVDGGQTWTAGGTCLASGCGQLIADPTGSGTLLASDIYLSRDWGLTFQAFGPPGFGEITAVAFDPSHPGWIYADRSQGVLGSLYLTTDYGASWTSKASPPSVFSDIMSLAVDPDQPNTLVAACGQGLYLSTDGAASWTLQAGPPGPQTAPYFSPDTGPSQETFVLVHHTCNTTGGILSMGSDAIGGSFGVAFSSNFGVAWTTPQLSSVSSVASGPNCTLYVTRTATSDAFVAKLAPEGGVLWATYLGGSDKDAPVALSLDTQGNVYVAGNTISPDFPVTVPHIGPSGEDSVFLTKFSPDGDVIYSATIGGESTSSAIALAIDASQNAYIAGTTSSLQFPVTPGVLGSTLAAGSDTGFLVKLSSNATLTYATYLGPAYTYPGAILVDANQEPIVAGSGQAPGSPVGPAGTGSEFVVKLDHAAAQVLSATYLPAGVADNDQGVTGMAFDLQNNLVVFGQTEPGSFEATPGAFSSPQPASYCDLLFESGGGDAFVMKLGASNWQPIYGALFTAPCGMVTGAVAIDPSGASVLALSAGGGLPLRSPFVAGPACSETSSAIAKLSADGSTLKFGTYLNNCGVPGIAVAGDGSVYAGVSPLPTGDATSVLHFKNPNPAPISIDQISNAFSGDASAVAGGGLYSIATSGFSPSTVNLGINPSENLPTQLSGVEVTFDGVPAAILSTAPGQIIVAAPQNLPILSDARPGEVERSRYNETVFTSVQLLYNGVPSNTVSMPVSKSLPGLLTLDALNPVYHADYADANARNQDGTLNSATNPAPAGSTITLFTTGVGATNPPVAPGSIALSPGVSPITPLYSSWETAGPGIGEAAVPLVVSDVPGFVSAVFQVQIPVPTAIQNLPGTDLGNGIMRVVVALQLGVLVVDVTPPVSNLVAVYVH